MTATERAEARRGNTIRRSPMGGNGMTELMGQIGQIIDAIPTLVWSADSSGAADFFNMRWLEYTGLTIEQALDSGWKVAVHPDDLPNMLKTFQNAVDSGIPFEVDGRFRRNDGQFRWFLFRGGPMYDDSGHIVKWYGVNIDLEDRKRAEQTLKRSEAYLSEAQKLSHTGSFTWNISSGVISWSQETYRIFECDPTTAVDFEFILQRTHPHDRTFVQQVIERVTTEAQEFDYEQRLLLSDGSIKYLRVKGLPLEETTGPLELVGSVSDITETKQAEMELRRNERSLMDAQRLTHTGSWVWNLESQKFDYLSPEHFRIFGFEPGPVIPSNEQVFRLIHPDDLDRVYKVFTSDVFRQGIEYSMECRIITPDGTMKYLSQIGHPIANSSGELSELIGTTTDVTKERVATAALEAALEEIKILKEQLYKENLALRDEVDRISMFEDIVGNSSALQAVLSRVIKVAPTDSTVLITGETGTGKELIARAIHKRSHRSQRAFVSVNCAALASSLLSSELFGHEKGAFTGAIQRRMGRFELADGGTIFLDEVGELPLDTQVALLRVLQEREFERVGGTHPIKVDVRVIAATNRNLDSAKATGTFRSDLFYRLNVFPIEVPPLRQRKDDVSILLEYLVHQFARKVGKQFGRIDRRTLELFRDYDWPGNIRELQNVVERSVILSSDDVFCVDEAWLLSKTTMSPKCEPERTDEDTNEERKVIELALTKSRGKVGGRNGAAAQLQVPASTLESRIKKLGINKKRYKLL
jgi:PAS domain S-box-containing protein